jgi:unsaturated rhamnogalacturonyl hydrolase
MKQKILFISAGILLFATIASAQPELTADSIIKITRKVASYRTGYARDWIASTCCTGVMALYQTTQDTQYLNKMVKWGQAGNWMPADGNPFTTNADHQCCCQTYCETYLAQPADANKNRYGIWKADWDSIIFKMKPAGRVLWSWEDALFMAPPAVAMLGTITGDAQYFDSLSAYWWDASDMLYDTTLHMFYRDASKVNGKYNGVPVFWARGNGWVAAGYARMLKYMPASYTGKQKHIAQFIDLCTAIKSAQGADGLWRTDMLSPTHYPDPEMSGTCFFCFAFAWGVNNGILDKTIFTAAAKKAWSGMVKYVKPDGSITNVQSEGGGPAAVGTATQPYAEGGFMLAGSEMAKLVTGVGTVVPSTSQRTTAHSNNSISTIVCTKQANTLHAPAHANRVEIFDIRGRKLYGGPCNEQSSVMTKATGVSVIKYSFDKGVSK